MTKTELKDMLTAYKNTNQVFFTHTGHKLSVKEYKFINSFLVNGDAGLAAKDAGYTPKDNAGFRNLGYKLLKKDYVYEELLYRLEELDKESIADANEIMQYFTNVMRGEEKDQFGLDAPLSERTAAAKELAKRLIDVPAKAAEEDKAIQIVLDWKRD